MKYLSDPCDWQAALFMLCSPLCHNAMLGLVLHHMCDKHVLNALLPPIFFLKS